MDMTAVTSPASINFNPALYLQRQELLLQTLRQHKPKSVLDIGCGQGSLLACLCNCDDGLPVELLAGLDISLSAIQEASSATRWAAESQQEEGRWRDLDVTLLQGSPQISVFSGFFLINRKIHWIGIC
jgi:2-polyprenyl-3-methyl-5-hydroxy-6-metoxy-1,4-benzoquinol methylase